MTLLLGWPLFGESWDIGDEERFTVTAYVHNVEVFPDEPFYNIPDLILFICVACYRPEGWDAELCDKKLKIER